MPYPSEHACRLRPPGSFEPNSFRRIKSGKLSLILGKLKGDTKMTAQARRYPKAQWTEAEARADCKDAGGSFEAAAASTQEMEVKELDVLDPNENPIIKLGGEDDLD